MANPDFRSESGADQGGTASATITFTGLTWQANDIICVVVATDGYVPTLSTANGFVIAQDPLGNSASVTTNGGTPSTSDCGLFVFWKRATGSTTASDPEPVIAAPTGGGTCWCLETNSYLGARTTGTPWHIISTAIVSTATSTVAPPAVTPTLNAVLVMPCAASANDDQAFNAWTLSGAASPAGQIDTGWHNGSGNACAFTGGRGGYATTGGARSGSTTFGATTKQAQITLVMASLPEAFSGDDAGAAPQPVPPMLRVGGTRQSSDDEMPPPIGDSDAGPAMGLPVGGPPIARTLASDDEFSVAAGGVVADDDGTAVMPMVVAGVPPLLPAVSDDEIPTAAGAAAVDEDGAPVSVVPVMSRPSGILASDDEAPTPSSAAVVEDEVAMFVPLVVNTLPLPIAASDDEVSLLGFLVDDDVPVPAPTPVAASAQPARSSDDEFPGGSLPPGIDEEARGAMAVAVPPAPIRTVPVVDAEFPPQSVTSGIGGASDAQRSFLAPPQTGTLTTVAPLPAWAQSTAYVVDPSQGGVNRVQNGGNHYQCSSGGTSASSGGGPSGTGTAITDGGVTWRFIGPIQSTNTAAGSQILCTVMRGNESQAATVAPTDNDGGGTYTLITDNQYVNFAGSFAGVWRRPTASNAKTNFQTSGVWGGSGGAGDEMSIGWIEVQGVAVGAPHAFSHVERTASSGGTVTAAAITTTVPCVIISYWFGNGTVQTAGQPDAATPAGGLTLIAGSTGELSLTTNGYVQHMVAWRKQATPGTFAEVWTASPTDQGAQLVTIALQDLSGPTGIATDDDAPVRGLVATPSVPRFATASNDELSPAADADADNDAPRPAPLWSVPVVAAPVTLDDEVAGLVVVEDDGVPVQGVVTSQPIAQVVAAVADELPVTVLEEWGQVMAVPVVAAPVPVAVVSDDETVIAATTIEDDALVSTVPVVMVPPLPAMTSDDEVPTASGASMIEEDALVSTVPTVMRPMLVVAPSVDEVASASGAATVDEDQSLAVGVRLVPPVVSVRVSDDEVGTALAVDEDGGVVQAVAAVAPLPVQRAADDDALAVLPIDEDAGALQRVVTPLPAVLWVAADDDLPLAALLDDAGQLVALTWSTPVTGWVAGDDEPATAVAPASIVDEDQLLTPLVWQVPVPVWGPIVADELPRPKKPKPTGAQGTSLLDGFIAKQVAQALGQAKMLKPATLIKVTPGTRTPGALSAGTNPVRVGYPAKGIEQNLISLQLAGTLLQGVDAAIRLFGATIGGGQVPVAGDQIVMAGRTYTIVEKGVSRDPASASYLCQCKL